MLVFYLSILLVRVAVQGRRGRGGGVWGGGRERGKRWRVVKWGQARRCAGGGGMSAVTASASRRAPSCWRGRNGRAPSRGDSRHTPLYSSVLNPPAPPPPEKKNGGGGSWDGGRSNRGDGGAAEAAEAQAVAGGGRGGAEWGRLGGSVGASACRGRLPPAPKKVFDAAGHQTRCVKRLDTKRRRCLMATDARMEGSPRGRGGGGGGRRKGPSAAGRRWAWRVVRSPRRPSRQGRGSVSSHRHHHRQSIVLGIPPLLPAAADAPPERTVTVVTTAAHSTPPLLWRCWSVCVG